MDRPDLPRAGSERELLLAHLDHARAAFRWKCEGLTAAQLRSTPTASSLSLAGLLALHAECVGAAREAVDACDSLDHVAAQVHHGQPVTLRWILLHMLDEVARHNGHADIVREAIDGAVGY